MEFNQLVPCPSHHPSVPCGLVVRRQVATHDRASGRKGGCKIVKHVNEMKDGVVVVIVQKPMIALSADDRKAHGSEQMDQGDLIFRSGKRRADSTRVGRETGH